MVFGILNLVFGTIWLLVSLCCGVSFGGFYLVLHSAQQPGAPPEQQDLQGMLTAFTNNVPGFVPVLSGYLAAKVLLAVAQLVSAIGSLWIQNWARWLCALWGILEIATILFMLGYQVAVVTPSMPKVAQDMERWVEKLEQKQRQRGVVPPPRQKLDNAGGTGNPFLDNIVLIVLGGCCVAYAGAAFIFMVLPQTGQAIARYHGKAEGLDQQRPDDLYDDDYERKRRELEQPPEDG